MNLELTRHDLKVLSICYYIHAGTVAFSALFCLAYASFLSVIFNAIPTGTGKNAMPEQIKTLIATLLVAVSILTIVAAIVTFLCARFLPRTRNRGFCYVVAAVTCLAIPYGTALGVFTFLVLARPEAKQIAAGMTSVAPGSEPPPVPLA